MTLPLSAPPGFALLPSLNAKMQAGDLRLEARSVLEPEWREIDESDVGQLKPWGVAVARRVLKNRRS